MWMKVQSRHRDNGRRLMFLPIGKDHHHHKNSVMDMMKAKAKRWKHLLRKMKHSHVEDAKPGADSQEKEKGEPDAQYHGAPKMEPNTYKEIAMHHQEAIPVTNPRTEPALHPTEATKGLPVKHSGEPESHHLNSFKETSDIDTSVAAPVEANAKQEDSSGDGSDKTFTETMTEILAPEIHGPSAQDESGCKQVYDKGVSMEEYVLHELEQGEEDKTLSHVITESASPRKSTGTSRRRDGSGGEGEGSYHFADTVRENSHPFESPFRKS